MVERNWSAALAHHPMLVVCGDLYSGSGNICTYELYEEPFRAAAAAHSLNITNQERQSCTQEPKRA